MENGELKEGIVRCEFDIVSSFHFVAIEEKATPKIV